MTEPAPRPALPTDDPAGAPAVAAMVDLDHPLKRETAEWAAAELAQGDRVERDRCAVFGEEDWRRCAERGIQGVIVDPALGGRGLDLASALLIMEGLGYGCRDQGLAFALASQIFSTQIALAQFGSDEQQARWMPGLVDGSVIGTFAITEPESGSDAYSMAARAERVEGGGYRITGHKAYLTLATRSDVVIVFASTRPDAGRWGISGFVVPTNTPGVEIRPNRDKMGMRTTPFGDIVFDGAEVPESARLGPEGAGVSIFSNAMEYERAFVFSTQIGAMERGLDDSVAYAREREQGGVAIGTHQAVSHRLADMKLRHETARTFLYKSVLQSALDRPVTMTAALTKLVTSEGALANAIDATLLHGAKGYVSEFEVERDLRDAAGGLIYSGTSDIQKNIVARLLGVG
ncbi:MAG: acyl-CoA dehydrogenase family protein [Actinomycetota bacterium]